MSLYLPESAAGFNIKAPQLLYVYKVQSPLCTLIFVSVEAQSRKRYTRSEKIQHGANNQAVAMPLV